MKPISEVAVNSLVKNGRTCVLSNGKVYDVTDFVNRHPGGADILKKHSGEDVTQVMKTHDIHEHSASAYRILDKYFIGDLSSQVRKRVQNSGDGNGNTDMSNKNTELTQDKVWGLQDGESNGYVVLDANKDDLADWSKPIFWQVGNFGERYFDWCHDPVDHHVRLFENNIIETLSCSPWWLVVLYWVPICSALLWYSYSQFLGDPIVWNLGLFSFTVPLGLYPVLFLLGILMWTFDEYVVHRWLFHLQPPADSKFLIYAHFLLHGQHHKSPMDEHRLVFPPAPASILAAVIYSLYRIFAPPAVAQVLFAGTIVGYMCYDLIHYYLHHGTPFLTYFQDLKTYHVKHHYKDQQRGFGISSKLWDYPFGTLIR